MRFVSTSWTLWLFLGAFAVTMATCLATDETFDVIVIGSGAGGLAAAELLTRDPNVKVLMLEAGLPSVWETGGRDAFGYMQGQNLTKFDVPGEYNNVIYNPEHEKYRMDWIKGPYMWLGKLIGGCSSIHASLYFHPPDSYVHESHWPFSVDQVNANFDAIEHLYDVTGFASPDNKYVLQSVFKILQSALQFLGYRQQNSLNDATSRNNKSKTFGHAPYTIKNGLRDIPAKFFYGAMKRRSNFRLISSAVVSHIVQTQGKASAVVYNAGIQVNLTPQGAVIVAAGALNTPKVLIQSGIGPKDQLDLLLNNRPQQFPGVTQSAQRNGWVVNDNVGKNLFDTAVVFATFQHPQMDSFRYSDRPQWAIDQYLHQGHTGPWASPGPVMIAYENYQVNGRYYEFEMTVLPNGFAQFDHLDHSFTTSLYVNNPESRDYCSFDAEGSWRGFTQQSLYMATPNDLAAMQSYASRIVSTLESQGATFVSKLPGQSVAEWVASDRNHITHHFGGTCYTSSQTNDLQRCADETFRVIGTSNIFVGDASLMKLGTTNPYGFVMQLGHQAGQLVRDFLVHPTSATSSLPQTNNNSNDNMCVLQRDLDFVGHDLSNQPAAEASLCCGKCRSFGGCHAFTWTNHQGGTCWLKSVGEATTVKWGAVSGTIGVNWD